MIETYFDKRELFQLPSFEEDWERIVTTFEHLAKGFKIYRLSDQEKKQLESKLKQLSTLKSYISCSFVDAVILEKDSYRFNLVLLSIKSEVAVKNRHYVKKENLVEYEFAGFLNLNQSFGHVLIRPETLGDKISEIFNKEEIDFDEEKEFSKKYYFTATDQNLVLEKMPRGILKVIGKQQGVFAEIAGKDMLIQFKKRFTEENAVKIATLSTQILENQ